MGFFKHGPRTSEVLRSRQDPSGQKRYGFWSPELQKERAQWFKMSSMIFLLMSVCMFAFLSIYFGSYYQQIPRASHFTVEVIDMDSVASPTGAVHPAILGPAVNQAVSQALTVEPHLGWFNISIDAVQTLRTSSEGRGVEPYTYAMERVLNQDIWAALIVNANATSGVWDAINSGATWDPQGAITFVWQEARNFYGTEQYIERLNIELITRATGQAAVQLASQVLQLANASAVIAEAPPGTVTGGFNYNSHDLRPFDMLGGIPATTVGTIYLIIFTFLISGIWNQQGMPIIQDKLALGSEVALKILIPFLAYFWMSLHYSLISLAFEVRFSRLFGRGGFVVYWMADWITMSALGFVMETVFLWLGPFFTFFLIFWVILNVSTAFLDVTDMAQFYRYGYFVPVWNLVDMSKAIIFATKNHLVQNFAVNLGWMVVWMILLAITVIYQRRRKEAQVMKDKWNEMKKEHERRRKEEKRPLLQDDDQDQ